MADGKRFAREVRAKTFEVLGRKACGWCFRDLPLDQLTLRKRTNGKKSPCCQQCLSKFKPKGGK